MTLQNSFSLKPLRPLNGSPSLRLSAGFREVDYISHELLGRKSAAV